MNYILTLLKNITAKINTKTPNRLTPKLAKDTGIHIEVLTLPSGKQIALLLNNDDEDSTDSDTNEPHPWGFLSVPFMIKTVQYTGTQCRPYSIV